MTDRLSDESISPQHVIAIAQVLNLGEKAFLTGGQALNLWAERYVEREPSLKQYAPFTSKDIDYFGYVEAAKMLADAFEGTLRIPSFDESVGSSAVVTITIDEKEIVIDFINCVIGVKDSELKSNVFEVSVVATTDDGDIEIIFPVMHPLHCLQSRVANILTLKRSDQTAINQLYISPIVVREYIQECIDDGDMREACGCLKRIFEYCRRDVLGRKIHISYPDADPLRILKHFETNTALDERFRNNQIARWIGELEQHRIGQEKRIQAVAN